MRPKSISMLLILAILFPAVASAEIENVVPYQEKWGIYELDPSTWSVNLVYTTSYMITAIRLNNAGDTFAFSQRIDGDEYADEEICTLGVDGTGFRRLTHNDYMDVYPVWSPDGSRIAFLSWPSETLDIYVMDSEGGNQELLYDSGFHDSDIHWRGNKIAFTRNSQIWVMDDDGTGATQLTDHPRAGEWGNAVLPFGDYDPRISPDRSRIVFERMVDDASPHGNYDLFCVNIDGSGEAALTDTGWTQGMAVWSSSGEELVYLVSAIGTEGRYDIYTVNSEGTDQRDLTSDLFPQSFLAHCPLFSPDDSKIYFVGEWWDWKMLETTIFCSLQSAAVLLGDPSTVAGSIEPSVSGANVTLIYTKPDGSSITRHIITEADGSYSDSYEPSELGTWWIEASWDGDPGHHASRSQSIELSVIEPEPETEESSEGGSIPGFPLEATFIGLILGFTIYFLMRRR
jgi:Tol biopolymer transport system component